MKNQIYADNGVTLSKSNPKAGDEVELKYFGLLKISGAQEVKVHFGYNENWEDAGFADMVLLEDAFSAKITLTKAGSFNFAFVDPAGNWDNNYGSDFSYEVKTAAAKAAKAKPAEEKADEKSQKKTTTKKTSEKTTDSKAANATKEVKSSEKATKAKSKKVKSAEMEAAVTLEAKAKKISKEDKPAAKKTSKKAPKE